MSKFTGTLEDFYKFLNPLTRNLVANISRKEKKHRTCSHCKNRTKLEAAHLKGKERPVIVANIIYEMTGKKEISNNDIIDIDLNLFLEKFIEEHTPLEKSVIILCKSCHREYDKTNNIEIEDHINVDELEEDELSDEAFEEAFEEAITTAINKKDIISIVKNQINELSDNDTFFFANINKTVPVWWIEPNKDKLLGSWVLLNNKDKKEVHVFKINNSDSFDKLKVRENKNNPYKLEISTEKAPNHFIDRLSHVDFKEYYIQTIKY